LDGAAAGGTTMLARILDGAPWSWYDDARTVRCWMVEGDVASVKVGGGTGHRGGIGMSFAPTRQGYRETGLGSTSLGMTQTPSQR
jgi:hypothetical protein